jgi:disulfide bond formation protein DsbB
MTHKDGWLAAIALACVAAVGAALVSQHRFDMQPCPWCVLQRVIFLAIALACVLALVWRSRIGRGVGAALGIVMALCGIAAALWQHFVAAASASCNLTLADKIISRWLQLDSLSPDVFEPRASCADAAANLLGVPYEFWSLALFALMALGLSQMLRRPETR